MKIETTKENWNGVVFRLAMLMTHYRQPLPFSEQRMREAEKILRRWIDAAERNDGPAPMEVLEALCDDLNTPKAIAALHIFRRSDPQRLYSGMKLLGLIPGDSSELCSNLASGVIGLANSFGVAEVKTIPDDRLSNAFGPDVVGYG